MADVDVADLGPGLRAWLDAGYHGEMDWMARHASLRLDPSALVPGTASALMARIDYAPDDPAWVERAWQTLADPERAYVSRYALGRDYHKVVRHRLLRLAARMAEDIGPFGHRVFCDSAPVMEVALAARAGLGWRGKHTLLIDRAHGSTFFLGTVYTDLALPPDPAAPPLADGEHCGSCTRCLDACPTGAIVAPYRLDARRCLSYLTIEKRGAIPVEFRAALGNRIVGCDDCQLACPWNRWAQRAPVPDFAAREGLDAAGLVELFAWTPEAFEARLAGSAIRRIGHERWLRNLAVALGNALRAAAARGDAAACARLEAALSARADDPSPVVREHVTWALAQRGAGAAPDARR